MENSIEFYKIEISEHVRESKFPIKMSSKMWQDIELLLIPYVLEEGDFDNLHLCWKSVLASIVKMIVERKNKHNKFTLKLSAAQYYALREFTNDSLPPNEIIPGLVVLTVIMSEIKI